MPSACWPVDWPSGALLRACDRAFDPPFWLLAFMLCWRFWNRRRLSRRHQRAVRASPYPPAIRATQGCGLGSLARDAAGPSAGPLVAGVLALALRFAERIFRVPRPYRPSAPASLLMAVTRKRLHATHW